MIVSITSVGLRMRRWYPVLVVEWVCGEVMGQDNRRYWSGDSMKMQG